MTLESRNILDRLFGRGDPAAKPDAPVRLADMVVIDPNLPIPPEFRLSGDISGLALNPTDEAEAANEILASRQEALTQVHSTLEGLRVDLDTFFMSVPLVLPEQITGRAVNPDGSAGAGLSIEAEPAGLGDNAPWIRPITKSDARGAFSLRLPKAPIPAEGLRLVIRGANGVVDRVVKAIDLEAGRIGIVPLSMTLKALVKTPVGELLDVTPVSAADADEHPEEFASKPAALWLGEGDCATSFRSNAGVLEHFGYSVLIRLVAPQVTPKRPVFEVLPQQGAGTFPMSLPTQSVIAQAALGASILNMLAGNKVKYTDRIPVERPIDVSAFHSQINVNPMAIPRASSIGLGYAVRMRQIWVPAGLSLGDMLYALPLAPGEQQRIAIHERQETLSVQDLESMSVDEAQQYREGFDTSSAAIFTSAAREAAAGGSRMDTSSEVGGIGFAAGVGGVFSGVLAGIGVAGGHGSSSSSGSSSSWQSVSRDFVSSAAQDFHSALARQSHATRRANRAGVRLAAQAEREAITSKVITNHNRCHALTVQYWEVLRHFAVTTRIEDVQLLAFVPLELVRFLPTNAPLTLPTGTYSRDQLLARYGMVLRYADVLERELVRRPDLRQGIAGLRNFAANPTMMVQPSSGSQQDTLDITLKATLLPNEEMFVSVVSKGGVRIGPVRLTQASGTAPLVPDKYTSEAELLNELRNRRGNSSMSLGASIPLPDYIARSDIARLEITRRTLPIAYTLKVPWTFQVTNWLDAVNLTRQVSLVLSPAQIEQELGGPIVWAIKASIGAGTLTVVDAYASAASAVQMASFIAVAANRLAPVLSFADLLRIEATFQHIVRNTVTYSMAVWQSVTPEERAILLEGYTIGVPVGGMTGPTEEVPLLSCVANQVVAYFGNSMVMPFHIPPLIAAKMKKTTRDVQEALLRFHRQAFLAPDGSITLPTRGMLGEAVLGSCNSCEKIDLTRFWNWKDSPTEQADAYKAGDFRAPTLPGPAGATGPSALPTTPIQNLLTIGGASPAAPDLIGTLSKAVPAATTFPDMTGMTQLGAQLAKTTDAASAAEKQAVDTAKGMAELVITKLPEALKASEDAKDSQSKREADQKKADQEEDERQAKEDAKLKADLDKLHTASLLKLASGATSYVGVAGSQANQPAADAWAQSLLGGLFGVDNLPSPDEAAALYGQLQVGAGDDQATKQGKNALLKALGLPTTP